MSARRLALLLPLVALTAAACGDDETSEPEDSPDVELDGLAFVSESVDGHDLVEGSTISLAFADGSLSANPGCNSLAGGYTIDGDTLQVNELAQTAMACDEALMDQEAWFSEFLASGPTVALDGDTLTLAGDDATITFIAGEFTTPEEGIELDGREFLSQSVEGHELVEGSTIRLGFADGSVSAQAGCNNIFGGYTLDGDVLVVDTLGTTEMACDPALMEQDTWLVEFLSARPTVALDGDTLTLTGADATITLLDRTVADPDRPIEGTRWVVDGLAQNEGVSTVPIGVTAAMTITAGQAAVEAGCNTGSASVEVGETTLTFGPMALTRMMCGDDAMAVEQLVTQVLDGEVEYEIEADVLRLTNGDVGLHLRAEE